MKTTRVSTTRKSPEQVKADLLVYCLSQEEREKIPSCDPFIKKRVEKAFELGDFSAKSTEELLFYPSDLSAGKECGAKRILAVGMGKTDGEKPVSDIYESLRKVGGKIAKTGESTKSKILTVVVPGINELQAEMIVQSLAEGILLSDYRFDKYKKSDKKKNQFKGIEILRFAAKTQIKSIRNGVKKAVNAAQSVYDARDMANEPGNGWTSGEFAEYGRKLAETYGFKYTCLEKKDMEKKGMGGILGVNQGSQVPPRMIVLAYQPKKKSETILLVGKGITFDSGGISLKPASGMEEMKYDMCGGAAVLSTMKAVGEEKPSVGVVAIVPATDNMSGSGAIHPGDILQHYNKVTAEIVSTDAEGRMILGDALSYGIEKFKPDCVIDIATLTGAVVIGLGHHHTGLMGNHEKLADFVLKAGEDAGEPAWQLPLTKAYKRQIESKVADIKNIGGRSGGSITAAAYLSNFVGNTPWVHLDIAGTAWNFTEKTYIPKGPSGICVRTFLYLIRSWEKGQLK